jgi:oxygen-independent coproporphyrinogen-3 oxidase
VYIGGGTPTELPPADLERLFGLIRDHIDLSRLTEMSCEANPGTLDAAMADTLVRNGVNRVSLGVQSFHDPTLELLGRIHNAAEARKAVQDLRAAGVDNLSVDLLFGLPTPQDTTALNLDVLGELRPEHVSWYSLEYEPGTAFTALRDRGALVEPEEEQMAREYTRIRDGLREQGFQHYELFSFCRPGQECRHNLNYWTGGGYHGCGPSAHRHVDGRRSANLEHPEHWSATRDEEDLSPEAKARELLMTGLRLTRGVELKSFHSRTGFDPEQLMGASFRAWTDAGWLEQAGGHLRLTPEAYLISDSLFREFI